MMYSEKSWIQALPPVHPAAQGTQGRERGVDSDRLHSGGCVTPFGSSLVLSLSVPPCAQFSIRSLGQKFSFAYRKDME